MPEFYDPLAEIKKRKSQPAPSFYDPLEEIKQKRMQPIQPIQQKQYPPIRIEPKLWSGGRYGPRGIAPSELVTVPEPSEAEVVAEEFLTKTGRGIKAIPQVSAGGAIIGFAGLLEQAGGLVDQYGKLDPMSMYVETKKEALKKKLGLEKKKVLSEKEITRLQRITGGKIAREKAPPQKKIQLSDLSTEELALLGELDKKRFSFREQVEKLTAPAKKFAEKKLITPAEMNEFGKKFFSAAGHLAAAIGPMGILTKILGTIRGLALFNSLDGLSRGKLDEAILGAGAGAAMGYTTKLTELLGPRYLKALATAFGFYSLSQVESAITEGELPDLGSEKAIVDGLLGLGFGLGAGKPRPKKTRKPRELPELKELLTEIKEGKIKPVEKIPEPKVAPESELVKLRFPEEITPPTELPPPGEPPPSPEIGISKLGKTITERMPGEVGKYFPEPIEYKKFRSKQAAEEARAKFAADKVEAIRSAERIAEKKPGEITPKDVVDSGQALNRMLEGGIASEGEAVLARRLVLQTIRPEITTAAQEVQALMTWGAMDTPAKAVAETLRLTDAAVESTAKGRQGKRRAKSTEKEMDRINNRHLDKAIDDTLSNLSISEMAVKGIEALTIKKSSATQLDKVKSIAKRHYSEKKGGALEEKLIREAGMSIEDAGKVAGRIRQNIDKSSRFEKDLFLNKMHFRIGKKANRQRMIDESIEISNRGGEGADLYFNKIAEANNLPRVSVERMNEIVKKVGELKTHGEEGSPARLQAESELFGLMKSDVKSSIWRKIATAQTLLQLFNVKTIVRNFYGNLAFAGLEALARQPAAAADKLLSQLLGIERTVAPFSLRGTERRAVKAGLKEGWKIGKMEVKEGHQILPNVLAGELVKSGLSRNEAIGFLKKVGLTGEEFGQTGVRLRTFDPKAKGKILGPLERGAARVERGLGYSLRGMDARAFMGAYRGSIENQMRIQKVKTPTTQMLKTAAVEGLYKTFQDVNLVSSAMVKLKRDVLNLRKELGAGDFLLKYPKIPANLFMRAMGYTPLGALRGIVQATRLAFQVAEAKRDPSFKPDLGLKREASMAFGRSVTGSAVVAGGYLLAKMGVLKGKKSKKKKEAGLEEAKGYTRQYTANYSAWLRFAMNGFSDIELLKPRADDTLLTFDWAQPASSNVSMGVRLYEVLNDKDSSGNDKAIAIADAAFTSIGAAMDTMIEQPLFSGIRHVVRQRDAEGMMAELLKGIPTSFIPTFVGQLRYFIDPNIREWKTSTKDKNTVNYVWNLIQNKVPYLSQNLPKKRDIFGKEITIYKSPDSFVGKLMGIIDVFAAPYIKLKYKESPAIRYISDLYQKSDRKIILTPTDKRNVAGLKKFGETISLTKKQQLRHQKIFADLVIGDLERAIKVLKRYPIKAQVNYVRKIMKERGAEAKEILLKEIAQ